MTRAASSATASETRERLLEAAAKLFAARGFQRVTVREICRAARANVAAVNYHFGDKLGLYAEVVRTTIAATRGTGLEAMRAEPAAPGEEKLRRFVRVFLERLVTHDRESRMYQLMSREMADPTPVLDSIVAESIRPRIVYLAGIVAEMLGCRADDARALRCAASVQGQCLIYSPTAVSARLGMPRRMSDREIDALADHITRFSMAGIRAVAQM
jgi:TetR/AcrR family transcriptional regulator, regulator of cefoperazone and chloramphenicol sensitivity